MGWMVDREALCTKALSVEHEPRWRLDPSSFKSSHAGWQGTAAQPNWALVSQDEGDHVIYCSNRNTFESYKYYSSDNKARATGVHQDHSRQARSSDHSNHDRLVFWRLYILKIKLLAVKKRMHYSDLLWELLKAVSPQRMDNLVVQKRLIHKKIARNHSGWNLTNYQITVSHGLSIIPQ